MTELLYKPDKTSEDINSLIGAHKNLIYFMLSNAGQLYNQDCESAAWGALWKAVCTFDVNRHTAFSTYACAIIRNAINDVLRKEATRRKYEAVLEEINDENALVTTEEFSRIEPIFAEFIATRSNLSKNIMLVWQASEYTASGATIARICSCSEVYVGRVKQDFRAFLSAKLKEP